MEEKVEYILKIINEDGDSFAKRAEMYYKKRPELVNFVEDSFRGYRALAERYDHLSRELQSANKTIATVYPERVQLSMDDDDDDQNFPTTSNSFLDANKPSKGLPVAPKLNIPKLPTVPKKNSRSPSRLMSKKGLLKINATDAAAATASSGLSKAEAVKELDKLQKDILALQTENEFVKSSYESRLAKYWEIENQVTEMQAKVSSLQDEFGIGKVIEDDEARTLMASTALKSCLDTLVSLQEKQEQSTEEARLECRRIQDVQEQFKTLKEQLISNKTHGQDISQEYVSGSASQELKNLEQQVDSIEQERHDLKMLRSEIKKQLQVNADKSPTMSELAEKIDELIDKVILLEIAVFSQNALVKRLRSETSELQAHVQRLGADKETQIEDSDSMINKMRELEEELNKVQSLNQSIKYQNKNLQIHFTEASLNVDHLSEELTSVKPDENPDKVGEMPKPVQTEEEKKDDTVKQRTSTKYEEQEYFVHSNSSNHIVDLSQVGQVRDVPDANSKGFNRQDMNMAPGHNSVILKDVREDGEVKKDDVADQDSSIKAEETDYGESYQSNELWLKGQARAAPDAKPQNKMKRSDDMMIAVDNSVILKLGEEVGEDNVQEHSISVKTGKQNFSQINPRTHSDTMSRVMIFKNDMTMEGEKNVSFPICSAVKADDYLSGNVQEKAVSGTTPQKGIQFGNITAITRHMETEEERKIDGFPDKNISVKAKEDENYAQSNPIINLDDISWEIQEPKAQEKDEKQDLFETVHSDLNIGPQELAGEEDDQPNWRLLFLNGLEDREKIILEEYTSVLRNYKEVKKKLSEAEKKKRASLFQSVIQIKVLRNANAVKDAEIQSLNEKLILFKSKLEETPDVDEGVTTTGFHVSDISSPSSDQKAVCDLLEEHVKSSDRTEETTVREDEKISHIEEPEGNINLASVSVPHAVSIIEEKIRTDIDDLLEENIEFWLRFSTSFHQIQKFQTSVQDLQEELVKLKEHKKQDGITKHQSDVRPIYRHLREIQTELTLWLEHNSVLKDDLHNRLSSLSTIQEEISSFSRAGSKAEDTELSDYQAAKFQGEVLNMKQENNKIADELLVGLERVKVFQVEIKRTLAQLDEELEISTKNNQTKNSSSRSRIPLRSFLFGVKLKRQKPSIFACISPALQKQYSDLTSLPI
ncbi:unnamed protein product [Ilex paraguariensis]|uniref:NAB domain-containing protein n=1 Tax=Ilex paraguariensis TaxID=185542 RepID=A0ABC8UZU0_9AQUA